MVTADLRFAPGRLTQSEWRGAVKCGSSSLSVPTAVPSSYHRFARNFRARLYTVAVGRSGIRKVFFVPTGVRDWG